MLRFASALFLSFLGAKVLSPTQAYGGILSELHLGSLDGVPRAIEITALPSTSQVDIVIVDLSASARFGRITQVVSVDVLFSDQSLVLVHDGPWTNIAWAGDAVTPPTTSHVQQIAQPLDLPNAASGPHSGRAILVYAGQTGLTETNTSLLDNAANLAHLQSLGLLDAIALGPADTSRALTAEDLAALGGDLSSALFQADLNVLAPSLGSSFGRLNIASNPADTNWVAGDPDAVGVIATEVGRFQFNPAVANTSVLNPEPSAGLCWGIVMMLWMGCRRRA